MEKLIKVRTFVHMSTSEGENVFRFFLGMKKFAIINKIYQNYVIRYFRSLRISCTTTPLRAANGKRVNIFNRLLFSFHLVSL